MFPSFFPFSPYSSEKQEIKLFGKLKHYDKLLYLWFIVYIGVFSTALVSLDDKGSSVLFPVRDILCVSPERFPSKAVCKNPQRSSHRSDPEYSRTLPLDI